MGVEPTVRSWTLITVALVVVAAFAIVPGDAEARPADKEDCFDDGTAGELDVGLVIDRSGSMAGDKIDSAREGSRDLVANLTDSDQSGLVSYSSSATLDQPLTFDHNATDSAIANLTAGGSTATGAAINLSHHDFLDNGRSDVRPVMILLTDGFTNTGPDPVTEAREAKADGIEIFAIGLGDSVNEPELREIASDPESEHFFHPTDTDELREVFEQITIDLDRTVHNDTQAPGVSVQVPEPGRAYVDGVDVGPAEDPNVATVVGQLPFEVEASDNCYLEEVNITTTPGVGFGHTENATSITTDPFDCDAVPEGTYVADAVATDWVGLTDDDHAPFQCLDPGGQALSLGAWAGTAVPASLEFQTESAERVQPGHEEHRTAIVDDASTGLHAEGVEEIADRSREGETIVSSAGTEIAELTLLGGAVHLEGLVQEATATWNLTTGETTLEANASIAKATVAGQPVDVGGPGEHELLLPGGGKVVLFEEIDRSSPVRTAVERHLVHAYLPAPYSEHELTVGSVLVQAGAAVDTLDPTRLILGQSDAGSGGDAGEGREGAVEIGPGVYDGSTPGDDVIDTYAVELEHGEKLKAVLQPAARLNSTGGQATADTTPDATVDEPWVGGSANGYVLSLFDPDGQLRAESTLPGFPAAPQDIEMNADENGTWILEVERMGTAPGHNYSLGLSVTPVLLFPQNDALSGSDAPDFCSATDPSVPDVDTGDWPGVIRDDDTADTYRFNATIGDVVTATLKPGETTDGVDMTLRILDDSCQPLAVSEFWGPYSLKGIPEAILEIPAPYTGTYHVQIVRENGIGNHQLAMTVEDPMPALPDNDAGSGEDAPPPGSGDATPAPGPVFQGTMHDGDDGDTYAISFDQGGEATLAFSMSAGSTVDVTLETPGGATIQPVVSTPLTTQQAYQFTPPEAGTYLLEVTPVEGGGEYLVSHAQEPVPLID